MTSKRHKRYAWATLVITVLMWAMIAVVALMDQPRPDERVRATGGYWHEPNMP